jgi:aspartate aminotransferase
MSQVSERLAALSPSETLAMSQKSDELKAQGIDVINLSVGEPDFFTPAFIKEAAEKAIKENYSFYSPVPGYLSLRKAIAGKLKRENNLDYKPEQIVCSNGAKQSVCNVLLSIISPGDEVIVPAPYWVSYVEMVKLAEGKNVVVTAGIDRDFKITPAQLEAAITPRTRALILCSPSNPTGSVYSKEELQGLAGVLAKYPDITIISDEIYEHINYIGRHESIAQFEAVRDRVVIVNGVSKGYAMTGWRLGWIAAPQWIASACNKLQGQYTSGPSSIAQKAAEAAYNGPQDCVETMRQAFERRRNLMVQLGSDIPGFKVNQPQGAFYLFPDCSCYTGKSFNGKTITHSADLALYLLEEAHVASVGGVAFGAPECIRFSYATADDKLTEAMKRVKTALGKLCSYCVLLCSALLVFAACNKDEGLGGSSSIEGQVYNIVHYDDNFTFQTDTFPALGKKVYLGFGDELNVGEDVDAGLDGYYRFNYLREGNYTVYALSESVDGQKTAEIRKVKAGSGLTKAPALFIHSGKAYGTAMIQGTIHATYYHNGSWVDAGPGIGVRVYIGRAGEDAAFDDLHSGEDGIFIFQKLLPGDYVVCVETEDKNTEKVSMVKSGIIQIRETGKIYEIPETFEVFVTV